MSAFVRAAAARGVEPAALLRAAGLEQIPHNDPLIRIPFSAFRRLVETIVAATRDPYFGLYAANFLHASSLHALGLSLLASADLRDFCIRLARYFRFLTGAARAELLANGGDARLVFTSVRPPIGPSHDAVGAFLVRTIRELSDGAAAPTLVELSQSTPPDGGTRHAQAFGCPVCFDAPHTTLHFEAATLDRPFEGASRELVEHNERMVVSYLARLDRDDIESRVRSVLLQDLPSGATSKDVVARKLAMSPRTLQIKLANRGTSFQAIVDETRYALACGYMSNRSLSITEIAYLLGFSDTSNFSRAFRRWSGRSPSQHRDHGHTQQIDGIEVHAH